MIQDTIKPTFLLLFIFLVITVCYSEKATIYLCVDSMLSVKHHTGKEPKKLVYGYINGEKTTCMSEHKLRTLLSNEQFKDIDQELQSKQQKVLQQNAALRGDKNLVNADLRGMDLQGLDLSGANLSGALLESTDLRNAKLLNTNLTNASLQNAYCKNTNFKGSNFKNATLQRVFFQNANLTDTKGLTIENLNTAATLYKSKFDTEFQEIINNNLPNKCAEPRGTWTPLYTSKESKKKSPK